MVRIITLIGLNGAGKSTTGDIVAQVLRKSGYKVDIRPLARPLKLLAHKYCDLNKHENRFLLEEFAEELRYLFGHDIFVNLVLENSSELDYIVVPDMRFIEEFNLFLVNAQSVDIIECARNVETTVDDRCRLERLKSFGIPIIATLDCDRSELVTNLYAVVSQIDEKNASHR
ncbi:hypothetical protein [Bacteroides sp.]|uniref:hypothetical protein n=1 Tax=Bacteroides sp. TaxID=29523 RepID=UPI00260B5F3D|nr:hypothetical protein [Bacteroides sp.]MDD3039626.1 hypothetical protein [Bacteroides sp.]